MKVTINYLALFSFLFLLSCEKETNTEKSPFNVEFKTINLVCYPSDSISMTFTINSTNGKPPYNYIWKNPATFKGEGPFTMVVDSNLLFDVEVVDADNVKVEFQYEVIKDTIDPLKYDYRNPYLGFYDCIVNYYNSFVDPPVHSTYRDTIEVTTSVYYDMLDISEVGTVYFDFMTLELLGSRENGQFKEDSIELFHYYTPLALESYLYKGKKIQ